MYKRTRKHLWSFDGEEKKGGRDYGGPLAGTIYARTRYQKGVSNANPK